MSAEAVSALGRELPIERAKALLDHARMVLCFQTVRACQVALGASPGQLSLAGPEAGQLSLAEDPAGRLSLPPGERSE